MSGNTHEVLGPYVIYERLGAGGMATVHRADHVSVAGFKRPVALKRLFPHVADEPEMLKMFIHEARLASLLRHANVAQTYDLGKVDDTYFIAMEYVPGPTLTQIMKQISASSGQMPLPIALSIISQLCDALDHAHNLTDDSGKALGIIHRDVSPSNIIVSTSGVVKLIDFGIAKAEFGDVKTQTGMIKGKYAYIAPEYTFGHLDLRADLFGLGIVAHEILTTRRLFNASNDFETIKRLREQLIHPPSKFNPLVPPDLDDIVLTALQRDPDARWQSASAMRTAVVNVARVMPGGMITNQRIGEWVEEMFDRPSRPKKAFDTGLARTLDTLDDPSSASDVDVPTRHRLELEALGAVADAADPTIPPPRPRAKGDDAKWPVHPPRSSPNVVRRDAPARPSSQTIAPLPDPPTRAAKLPATVTEDFGGVTNADGEADAGETHDFVRQTATTPGSLDVTIDRHAFSASSTEQTNADWRPKRKSQPVIAQARAPLPGMPPPLVVPSSLPLGGPASVINPSAEPAKHLAPHQLTLVAERAALIPGLTTRSPAVPSLANAPKPVLAPSDLPTMVPLAPKVTTAAVSGLAAAQPPAERVTLLETPEPVAPTAPDRAKRSSQVPEQNFARALVIPVAAAPPEPEPRASIPAHVFPAGEESGELLAPADPAATRTPRKAKKTKEPASAPASEAPDETETEPRRIWPWLLLVLVVIGLCAAWYFYFIAGVDLNI